MQFFTIERGKSMYTIKWIRGEHIEVFKDGEFYFSADSMTEVYHELEESDEEEFAGYKLPVLPQ